MICKLLFAVLVGVLAVSDIAAAERLPVVALDIGHTPKVFGATSARGQTEYEFNKRIVKQLFDAIRKGGKMKAIVINRNADEIQLIERVNEGLKAKADVFVAIHHDAVQEQYLSRWEVDGVSRSYSDRFRGYSVFFSGLNEDPGRSRELAECVGTSLLAAGFAPTHHHAEPIQGENRPLLNPATGVYQFDDLVVLKYNKIPAVLVECGVIVHRDEEMELRDPAVQARIVSALHEALVEFFED